MMMFAQNCNEDLTTFLSSSLYYFAVSIVSELDVSIVQLLELQYQL